MSQKIGLASVDFVPEALANACGLLAEELSHDCLAAQSAKSALEGFFAHLLMAFRAREGQALDYEVDEAAGADKLDLFIRTLEALEVSQDYLLAVPRDDFEEKMFNITPQRLLVELHDGIDDILHAAPGTSQNRIMLDLFRKLEEGYKNLG